MEGGPVVVGIATPDVANYGDLLFPLITAQEVARRVAGVAYLPFGPVGLDDARAGCFGLGPWSESRAAEVLRLADLVLIGGGEIVSGDRAGLGRFYGLHASDASEVAVDRWFVDPFEAPQPEGPPVVWHVVGVPALDADMRARVRAAMEGAAMVVVRDEASSLRLVEAGVPDALVVPDLAWLMERVWPAEELARRRADLVRAAALPAGEYLVLQGNGTMAPFGEELVARLSGRFGGIPLVAIETSPCHEDERFVRSVLDAAPQARAFEAGSAEDLMAVIAGCTAHLGVSLHGSLTATVHGRPLVIFDPSGGHEKLVAVAAQIGDPALVTATPAEAAARLHAEHALVDEGGRLDRRNVVDAAAARLDDYFDRLAGLVVARPDRRPLELVDRSEWVHAGLLHPPRPVGHAVPETVVPGLVRPGPLTPDAQDAVAARARLGAEARWSRAWTDEQDVARLTGEVQDLRGALEHVESVATQAVQQADELVLRLESTEAELARVRAAITKVLRRPWFRLTRTPRDLRRL